MNSYKNLLFTLICIVTFNFTYGQETNEDENKLSLTEGTIDNQFEYVIRRSNNYQEFKVVKKAWLYELKAHTLDSIKAIQNTLSETIKISESQASEIALLKDKLNNTKTTLASTKDEKDNIVLVGNSIEKGAYKLIMWSIVGVLLVLLGTFIYKFRKSNAITKQAQQTLLETEEEFNEHRQTALEREQIVRRQLLDEINKNKVKKKDK